MRAATRTPRHAAVHRATYQDDRAATPLAVRQGDDAAHYSPSGCAPAPSPVAPAPLARETAPRSLHCASPVPQTGASPPCVAATHRPPPLVLPAPPPYPRS